MDEVYCKEHRKLCYLKTGVKDGPNKGKSFYVCGNKEKQCDFVQKAENIPMRQCSVHKEADVELQFWSHSRKTHEKRLYYRCTEGRSGGKTYCGSDPVKSLPAVEDPRPVENDCSSRPVVENNACKSEESESTKRPVEVVPLKPALTNDTQMSTPDRPKEQLLDFGSLARSAGVKPKPISSNPSLPKGMSLNDSISNFRQKKAASNLDMSASDSDNSDDDCFVVGEKPAPPVRNLQKEIEALKAADRVKEEKPTNKEALESEAALKTKENVHPPQDAATLVQQYQRTAQRKQEVARQIAQKKSLLGMSNVALLPDKGQKLKDQLSQLTASLKELDLRMQQEKDCLAKHPDVTLSTSQVDASGKRVVSITMKKQPIKNVAGQVLPEGVKQTKLTNYWPGGHHAAQQDYRQMLAAQPQMHSLYGGRMTQARLREVGQVTDEAIERLHKQLDDCPKADVELDDPKQVKVPLMAHQRQALAWLTWRETQNPPGGILADDMGLGKTLTMISLILKQREIEANAKEEKGEKWLSRQEQVKKMSSHLVASDATLVVCPASLVYQWKNEIERRCEPGALRIVVYHGPNREKDILKLAAANVVLTTYEIVRNEDNMTKDQQKNKEFFENPATDKEAAESADALPTLLRIAWHRLILDEAHVIKNRKSLTAMAACRIRAFSRWALTGTPIQNDLLDMYSLIRFLRCSPFDEYKVWKRQVDNKSEKSQKRLRLLVKTLLLRRTKDQTNQAGQKLVELPDKSFTSHMLDLTSHEKAVYDRIYQQSRSVLQDYLKRQEDKQLAKEGGGKGSANPWAEKDVQKDKTGGFVPASSLPVTGSRAEEGQPKQNTGGGQILLLLLRLRQCCSHLALMKDALDVDALVGEGLQLDLIEQMKLLALEQDKELEEPSVDAQDAQKAIFDKRIPSTKIKAVMEQMRRIRDSSPEERPMKSVIVSQWTCMLEIVELHLKREGFRCVTIKGNVGPKIRAELVDTFNSDPTGPEVMLVSLKAGGVGLNLIGGNHLFLIDLHWNPALEQQAIDRIYRVGQEKNVFIHKFLCRDSIEEKILQLQEKKMSLARNVLAGEAVASSKLTLADLRLLFDLDRLQFQPGTSQPFDGASGGSEYYPRFL